MTRHMKSCLPKHLEKNGKKSIRAFYHVVVTCPYAPVYWLQLKVAADAQLEDLDQFLRQIWLECCGHLSAFSINRKELSMNKVVGKIFKPGMELLHEYDFGSTTELQIKVIDKYEGPMAKNKAVEILARNAEPEIPCSECGAVPAVEICTECMWDGDGWLCKKCAKKHGCGEDMFLPVVNSPRTGVCGYTG
ncbi:MAG: hypothetical protein V2I97_22875 [Desulfococcaceae bacterium]|nr:hypothetical protein [Desulfococcaceae bacterium]